MTLAELRAEYQRAFGEPTYSCHKTYVRKRVAWGLQVREQGGLTARGHARIAALADETHLRLRVPTADTTAPPRETLPVGTQLVKDYHGTRHVVTVLEQGVAYDGQTYRSLTAVAAVITGTHRNGRAFFGLGPAGGGR
jgi:hypothetical protein